MTEVQARTPEPGEAHNALMVFDGFCSLCSGWVRLLLVADRNRIIRFTAVQSPLGQALCAAAGVDPADPSTFLFFDRGRPLQASDAVLAMLARLPVPWRWAVVLRLIPRTSRDRVYRWVARNRYRLFGRRTTCMIPPASVRERFLDDQPARRES